VFTLVIAGGAASSAGGCSSDSSGPGGGGSGAGGPTCTIAEAAFELGDENGHADPLGAKKAGQARAGRILKADQIVQPAHGRQKIHEGDFWLVNDKIAVAIEDKGLSDGYARFGGELLAIDKVGDDGRPMGVSYYIETLIGLSIEMVNPTSVTVLKDGSDGGEAVVRVVGVTQPIPFLEGPIGTLFPDRFGIDTAMDYVLAPGAEKVLIRLSVVNRGDEQLDFGAGKLTRDELFGFFQYSRSQLVTPDRGYGTPKGMVEWAGFDSGPSSFAFRVPDGKLEYATEQSGFSLFWGPGFLADPCTITTHDHAEVILGGPGLDGLGEAVRRATGEDAWRSIKGVLKDTAGMPVADAYVHEQDAEGVYLSRTLTAADGSYEIHAPKGKAVNLVPQKRGYPTHKGVSVAADGATADLAFGATALLNVTATDQGSNEPLPVRIQVIPKGAVPETPEAYGVPDEANGRLYQEFAMSGQAALVIPPGEYHVIVSHGYEWEIYETDVVAQAGMTAQVTASILHSVDTTGRMCADFHIHSWFSADSNDPAVHKVRGALADGLDIPVSSEHEWVIDFQPIIEQLGMEKWAFGMAAEELTTFSWGHFGVVPLVPKPDKLNAGAVEWIGKQPGEFFADVRKQEEDPALIVNHPRGLGFSAYFSASQYNRETGVGDATELWSDNFDAIEVFNDSDFEDNRDGVIQDWFSLLNHGHKFSAVGSSDSHHLRSSPVGYPRTCFDFGHDDPTKLSSSQVRDAIRSGDSTIFGGLYMTVLGPNGEHPGDEVQVDGNGEALFTVTVEGASWVSADTLEVIVNGASAGTEPLLPMGAGPSKKFVNQVKVKLDASAPRNWVLFHARGEGDLAPLHPGRKPFAASNPMFLKK